MGQHSQFNIRRTLVIASGLLVFIGALVVLVLWANDVRQDHDHSIAVEAPTPVFAGRGRGCDTHQQIQVVERGSVFQVRRIRYWKDCATLDVRLADGRVGHFVLGVGNLAVKPPLPLLP
jgi:hypothetical protein